MKKYPEILNDFSEQLDSLSDYVNVVSQNINNYLDEQQIGPDEKAVIDAALNLTQMVEEYKKDSNFFLERMIEVKKEYFDKQAKKLFPDEIDDDPLRVIESFVDKFSNDYCKFSFDGNDLKFKFFEFQRYDAFEKAMKKRKTANTQSEMFSFSSLITLTNSYEYMINKLLHYLIITKPEKIDFEKKPITFDELLKIGSIDQARELITFEMINEFMRKSNSDWVKKIAQLSNNNAKIYEKLQDEVALVNEIFQRRNIIVHNGGVINDFYINNVDQKLRKDKKKGDKITVESEYLNCSISAVFTLGVKLIFLSWQNVEYEDYETRFIAFQEIAYEKLRENQYYDAKVIYEQVYHEITKYNSEQKLIFYINYSQTLKWLNDDSYKNVIKSADFSLANEEHQMCLALIHDDFDSAVNLLVKIIENPNSKFTNDLSYYTHWPIFKLFKHSQQFKNFVEQRGFQEL